MLLRRPYDWQRLVNKDEQTTYVLHYLRSRLQPTCKQFGIFLVHQIGQISAIIEDHVERLTVFEVDGLFNAPHVFLIGFSLPGVHCIQNKHNSHFSFIINQRQIITMRFLFNCDSIVKTSYSLTS